MCEETDFSRRRAGPVPAWLACLLCLGICQGLLAAPQSGPCPEQAFHDADTDRNGQLNLGEFVQALERFGPFYEWDTNRDGAIAPHEFRQQGKVDFPVWDADGDGMLSHGEFNAGLYQAWDLNGDGQVNLRAWCLAHASGWIDPER